MSQQKGSPSSRSGRLVDRPLYDRLLAGDPLAPSELAESYLARLVERLRPRFSRLDPHLVESAAGDSIMNLAEHPERYDPERGGLLTYLYMDSAGDLLNAYKSGQRRARREVPLEDVELGPRARKLSQEEIDGPLEQLLRSEDTEPAWFKTAYAELDERERAVVELMIDGERSTAASARLIGVEHLPRGEQEREVKRWKDRLVKRLQRRAPRRGSDG